MKPTTRDPHVRAPRELHAERIAQDILRRLEGSPERWARWRDLDAVMQGEFVTAVAQTLDHEEFLLSQEDQADTLAAEHVVRQLAAQLAEEMLEGARTSYRRIVTSTDQQIKLEAAEERATHAEDNLRSRREDCNGGCDITLARRQIGPDGVVPGNARECAELWEQEATRLQREIVQLTGRIEEQRRTILEFEAPLAMQLYCPRCLTQHIDAPDTLVGWTNPPHRTHLCLNCRLLWRPADVATYGVRKIQTAGDADNDPAPQAYADFRRQLPSTEGVQPAQVRWNDLCGEITCDPGWTRESCASTVAAILKAHVGQQIVDDPTWSPPEPDGTRRLLVPQRTLQEWADSLHAGTRHGRSSEVAMRVRTAIEEVMIPSTPPAKGS